MSKDQMVCGHKYVFNQDFSQTTPSQSKIYQYTNRAPHERISSVSKAQRPNLCCLDFEAWINQDVYKLELERENKNNTLQSDIIFGFVSAVQNWLELTQMQDSLDFWTNLSATLGSTCIASVMDIITFSTSSYGGW